MTPEELDALRRALDGITPLPWAADEEEMYIFARGTRKTGYETMVADTPDGRVDLFVECVACDGSGSEFDADGEEDNCRTCGGRKFAPAPNITARMRGFGGGEPQGKNLHAIAAVMNAAPRLLAYIDELQDTVARLEFDVDAATLDAEKERALVSPSVTKWLATLPFTDRAEVRSAALQLMSADREAESLRSQLSALQSRVSDEALRETARQIVAAMVILDDAARVDIYAVLRERMGAR